MDSPRTSRLYQRSKSWASATLSPLLRRKTFPSHLDIPAKNESELEETDSPDSATSSDGRWSFSPLPKRKSKNDKKAERSRSIMTTDNKPLWSPTFKLRRIRKRGANDILVHRVFESPELKLNGSDIKSDEDEVFQNNPYCCTEETDANSDNSTIELDSRISNNAYSYVTFRRVGLEKRPKMSSIFPSISIKRKPKGSSSIVGPPLNQTASSPSTSQIFRPLTPEATRKVISTDKIVEPVKTSNSDQALASSSANVKEYEGDILDTFSSTTSSESKTSKSPRPHSRPSLIHRESANSFHDRSGSVNSETSLYGELIEAPMVDQEDIIALTHHVRAFSEALSALRNTFFEQTETLDDDPPEVKAHERLGEVLSILKGVLNQYQPLHSTDILAAAGTLINKVKSHNYEKSDKAPEEFCESIDQLALAFSSSVSDFLMGDQDMPISASREHSRSLEDFADDDEDDDMYQEEEEDLEDEDDEDYKEDRRVSDKKEPSVDKSAQKANELDKRLFGLEHGVDLALQRTKVWSKYAKDISTYLERRAHLEQEFTNKLSKLAQATRTAITEERYLPFQSIYVTSLDQDIEYAENCTKTYNALLTSKFLEPLQTRRTYHERRRKELKESWTKAYKKLNEAIGKLEKAKQSYFIKQQEIEKFKSLSDSKDGQELSASFTRIQKKKQEDLRKADDAEEWYKQCVGEANVRQRELMKTKNHVLVELRQLIYQCDQTMKAVTCNFFHMMNLQSTPAPIRFQCLEESSRAYEPGSQFSDFVYGQLTSSQPTVERVFGFESFQSSSSGSSDRLNLHTRSSSENRPNSPFSSRRNLSLNNSHPPLKAWGNNLHENLSDVESTGSKSAPVTPEGSPVASRRNNRPHRALDEDSSDDSFSGRESRVPRKPKASGRSGTGPFQNCRMSAAAQTHKFKKLRAPSRCRDCDSYVYFNGAECADCGLTCHRKCLARVKNRCDKKLNGPGSRGSNYNVGRRMTTFGVDFDSHLRATSKHGEYVPYIVSHCVDEINDRGLQYKGIYRVCGVKSKVEKACQIFENSNGNVDLQDFQPHVIAAVLKLYLRQLPEPLLTFRLYPEFIKIAKDESGSLQSEDISRKLREVVVKLPKANFKTAARIINHLKLVADNEGDNQMSASNLGIVFGPTLLRPWESANSDSVSMPALVDMQHQTKAVELLIKNPEVFDEPGEDDPASQETPIEVFSSVERDKNGNEVGNVCSTRPKDIKIPTTHVTTDDKSSLLNIPVSSKRLRKSSSPAFNANRDEHDNLTQRENLVLPVEPEEPVEPVDPIMKASRNKLGSQITPVPRSAYVTSPPASSPRNEYFDLLSRPNERAENERAQQYALPEFLLPGTTGEQEDQDEEDDKDVDDSYEDSTQGTSGSHTPDDELNSSRGSLGRDGFTPSVDSQMEESPVNQGESRDFIPKSTSEMSLISIGSSPYSMSASFGSDTQDDKLLPDLSEAEPTKREKLENFMSSQTDTVLTKSVDDLSVPNPNRPRPSNLGLLKRNSDLPGMISRLNFLPNSSKTSDSKESNKQPAERTSTPGTKKHQGISDALREMHVIYDPLIANADRIVTGGPTIKEEEQSPGVVKETPIPDTPLEDKELQENEKETNDEKEWYMTEQDEIIEPNTENNKLEYQPPPIEMQDALNRELEPIPAFSASAPQEQETAVSEKSFENKDEIDAAPKSSQPVAGKRLYKVVDVDGKAVEKPRSQPTRVSVKDRLKQYESTERADGARKTPSPPLTTINISSRKQIFENNEKGTSRRSREQKVSSLESHAFEKTETHKPKEPTAFKSRKVDIPFENANIQTEKPQEQERKKMLLASTNSYPLQTSPKESRRSPRLQFPDDSTKEDREPQFV